MDNNLLFSGQWLCGSVGRAVASDTRGLWFESKSSAKIISQLSDTLWQFSCHKVSLLYLKMPITRLETYSLDFVSRLSTTSMLSRLDFLLAVTNLHQILVRFEILIKLKIKNKEAGIIYEGRLSWIHFIVTYCHFASQWVKIREFSIPSHSFELMYFLMTS